MANVTKASIKSKLRQSNANYMDNLADSMVTLSDAQTLSGVNTFSTAPGMLILHWKHVSLLTTLFLAGTLTFS